MSALQTFIEPEPEDLESWFDNAQMGDECSILTRHRQHIMSLTKVGLSTVWWSLPRVGQGTVGFMLSIPFRHALHTWSAAQAS